ncbi:glycoside hydrolase family 104 protein [Halomonas sp. Mc5H-6]|uniref:glycoside hydrolase family 24 protein n=1 Tax=Halomonas sp. Mc5H-6 TaxID=2954500 RepID=UPI002096B4B4|nr:glycoside hydrolase family 104 protein [Halomonas sp. Mc5H-6]
MTAHSPAHWYEEAELLRFDPPEPVDTRAGNVAAFLDMLASAEGTTRFGDEDGYNVLVGGELFESYDDHPRQLVWLPAYEINSSAAGRYQFLTRTWDDLAERFDLPDFTPTSQDLGAVHLIRQCKALSLIHDGRIREAIHACRKIWASLPGAGYGQREVATDELLDVYKTAGGISID